MLQTVARPAVSLFVRCAYCPARTSFACLNCGTAICPECCPGDYCPDCLPAPVTPLVGWSLAHEGVEDDAVAVACAGCGDRIYVDGDPSDDAYCEACTMPAADFAALRMVPAPVACLLCGQPIYRGDADD